MINISNFFIKTGGLILLLCFCFIGHAEVYKWVDEQGLTHYSDTRPDESVKTEKFYASLISIDNTGKVVEEHAVTANTSPQPVAPDSKAPKSFGGKVANRIESGFDNIIAKMPSLQALFPQKLKPVVITNDNMDEILGKIHEEEKRKAEERANISVEIFTAPWCGYCKLALAYLDANKIPYDEYNVSANPAAALRQKMLGGGTGIPFAVINGEKIQGWNRTAYANALGL